MRFRVLRTLATLVVATLLGLPAPLAEGASKASRSRTKPAAAQRSAQKAVRKPAKRASERSSPWRTPTYADSTVGDIADGEDPLVRRIAVEALGPYNGSVVVVDAHTGRILALVNQKLALGGGFTPCSTIKIPVALAALSEGVIDKSTRLRVFGRTALDMTEALAHSDNPYFASLGRKLGFERVIHYARLFGLGERAGLNIEGEQPGTLPEAPPAEGGIGMMCSFGEGIRLTPLQFAALLSAIANGGTLYYLQHPRSAEEAEQFVPRVKRRLDIQPWLDEIKPGMLGAVAYGTARRAGFNPESPILGKTGTCTDYATATHLGWFGAFNESGRTQIAVVVLLTGGKPVNGPVASGIAGEIFRRLSEAGFFERELRYSPVALVHKDAWD
jgi:cell division protein FtsI/penicillin-binding protein 2